MCNGILHGRSFTGLWRNVEDVQWNISCWTDVNVRDERENLRTEKFIEKRGKETWWNAGVFKCWTLEFPESSTQARRLLNTMLDRLMGWGFTPVFRYLVSPPLPSLLLCHPSVSSITFFVVVVVTSSAWPEWKVILDSRSWHPGVASSNRRLQKELASAGCYNGLCVFN